MGVRTPFEGSVVLFRGCGVRAVREWIAQCHRADTGLTAQHCTAAGMASPGGLVEQHRDMIPRRVRGTAWHEFVFDSGACMCQNIKCSGRRSRRGSGEPVRVSSEAESHSRGCLALERGGASPAGASSPRARRSFARGASSPRARRRFARGGVQPLSEVESRSRGCLALERGGVSPEGASSPRARRRFARGGVQPSSKAESY
jgi:hypothetical protein